MRLQRTLDSATSPISEQLESRLLKAIVFAGGQIQVQGTAAGDAISIDSNDSPARVTVRLNGSVRRFNSSDVSSAILTGLDGNDRISVASNISVPTSLYGSAGNDTLFGGSGSDAIFGGDANDSIVGNGGSDVLRGENGNDRLNGAGGNDLVLGHDGNDNLYGSSGSDTLLGGNGLNFYRGGAGNDMIRGGANRERIFGEDA